MTSGRSVMDGRFELLERLGSGGMGTVWRALDLVLQREVALKEVRPGGGEVPPDDAALAGMYRERVLREARALARIDHPHVVTIHHIIDSPDMPYPWLVMELVRGESLQDRLARGALTPLEAARVGRGVLAALQAAHRAGICHRDIKPGNVLLREDGSPVLTDFGIAVLEEASRVTATGGLVGSPEYIAPERLHGREGDPASDLWSLGMLLYVAVEGHNPVRRTTLAATLAAVMTAQIPAPRQAGPLAEAIGALLVPDPAARPDAALLDRMLAAAEGQPTSPSVPFPAPHPPGPGPIPSTVPAFAAPPPRRQNPALLVLAGAGAVVLVFALAFFAVQALERDEGRTVTAGPSAGTRQPEPTETSEKVVSEEGGRLPESARPTSLLTPAGIRGVITAFEKATGNDKFAAFTVYEEYAYAEVPVPGRSKATDRYLYRNGEVTKQGAGTSDEGTVNLRVFDWNVVPRLLRAADRRLNVPDPENRYLVVKPSWTFAGDKPMLLVYLNDEHGGGYLAADVKGRIEKTYPAE
ncbi:serine/threonine-protein kinase [Actinocorallia sp. B10E7]|uniref:serine/threonine-protein kinase n=1 Tax=Actinocorallia sp. B10E7 TaxID=3153558 RepID=UPI00325DDE27